MDQELKAKWIEALRSGKYPQAGGGLRTRESDGSGEGYCCLGVLCDVSGVGKWNKNPSELNGWESWRYTVPQGDESGGYLPREVVEAAGLHSQNPEVRNSEGTPLTLATLNDCSDLTFSEIADIVEEQL